MKLLKNISGQTVIINTGNAIISVPQNELLDYTSYIVSNTASSDYNLGIFQDYLDNEIFAIVEPLSGVVTTAAQTVSYLIVNFSPAVTTQISPGDIVTFTNFTNIPVSDSVFLWTVTNLDTTPATVSFTSATSSGSANPKIQFSNAGIFTVTLTVTQISTGTNSTVTRTGLLQVVASGTVDEFLPILSLATS